MVYRFDEYVAEFPKKNVSTLKKFINKTKNLHEMSIEEINNIIATWGAVTQATATNQKSVISLYFDWLTENGICVTADINNIVIPVKTTEFLIYSSAMLHEYWNKFFESCEKQAAILLGETNILQVMSQESYLFTGLLQTKYLILHLVMCNLMELPGTTYLSLRKILTFCWNTKTSMCFLTIRRHMATNISVLRV